MWDRQEIKAKGKAAFKANYWACVLVAIILSLAVGGGGSASGRANDSDSSSNNTSSTAAVVIGGLGIVGLAVQILALNPLEAGCRHFFIENSREYGEKPGVNDVLFFFKEGRWGNAVKVMFVYKLKLLLWFLLFLIPGFIKSYSYRLVPYLLCQDPNISPSEATQRSKELMNGQKASAFVYDLSYIGWYLLGGLTFGILLIFHVAPWVLSADAVLCRTIAGEGQGQSWGMPPL